MSEVDEFKELVAASGRSQRDLAKLLSEALGRRLSDNQISQITLGHRRVRADEMDALRALAARPSTTVSADTLDRIADRVPLYAARLGGETIQLTEDYRVGTAAIHPSQYGFAAPFDFQMPDSSLGERVRIGDLVHCVKGLQPKPGNPCLVELLSGDCRPRVFQAIDGQQLVVARLGVNAGEERLELANVRALHAITGVTFTVV